MLHEQDTDKDGHLSHDEVFAALAPPGLPPSLEDKRGIQGGMPGSLPTATADLAEDEVDEEETEEKEGTEKEKEPEQSEDIDHQKATFRFADRDKDGKLHEDEILVRIASLFHECCNL
jgi:hypothetical protein